MTHLHQKQYLVALREKRREGDNGLEEFEDATQQIQGVKPMSDEIQDQARSAESMDVSKSTDMTSRKWQLALIPCAGPIEVERTCPKPQHSTGLEDVSHRGRQESVPPRISSSTSCKGIVRHFFFLQLFEYHIKNFV